MSTTQFHFTKLRLSRLSLPEKGVLTYHDIGKAGLKLMVRPSGTKTFVLYRKVQGKPERVTIGRYPSVTIEQARKQVDQLNAKIVQGINPNEEKRALRAEMTFAELFQLYLENHAKPHKQTWQEDLRQYECYLKAWSKRKLSSITRQHVEKLHIQMGEQNGHYIANRVLGLLRAMFNKATLWGWPHANPASAIKKFKEQSRERFIQADELPRFFESLNQEENITARDFFIISLLTGARKTNVMEMRWQDINFTRGTWTIPMTKNGEPHTLPLVDTALALLTQRKQYIDSPWVFPGNSASGHMMDPKKAWARILQHANIENLRIHDLRRSLGSWQASTGASLSIIGKTLAHKNVNTTAIYARLNIDPVRDAMQKATDAMLTIGQANFASTS
jgi:integrase